ncbi:hypothetical protein [Pleionea sp. CnH1-48]|uniref:hypothetical protein n=1 Tax=Pleionea sp. CnH1-48 TaxID=2954494 RepID=UPI0020972E5D|nr:hypothetical protein [Pleionea sp. CnH1-48]MCO7223455.1 hypothetical protein [Pleionea sp. CnH1-48]
MLIKRVVVLLTTLSLSGCASYIANQITSPERVNFTGNISNYIIEKEVCDEHSHCIQLLSTKRLETDKIKLSFNAQINDTHKIWQYQRNSNNTRSIASTNPSLIFIFTGYTQPTQILFTHLQWLQHITGAKVFVVPSADKSEHFRFGLDLVEPIVTEIQQQSPKKVHLIGFSMGAAAAQAVAAKVKNSQLHLIAPMTDFEYSVKALWKILYHDKFYASLISTDTIEKAIQIIHTESKVSPEELDITQKLQGAEFPVYLYTSNHDRVTLAADWNNTHSKYLKRATYDQLNHIEMVTLLDGDLLRDFVSNLLGREVPKNEVDITGVICNHQDNSCLTRL